MIKISDAELEVMKIIWEKGETNSVEIINELESFNWNDNTIRTLINRLIAKKAVGISSKNGKIYTYIPLVKREDYSVKRAKKFLGQFYNNSLDDLILSFVSTKNFSKKDLQRIINKIDDS